MRRPWIWGVRTVITASCLFSTEKCLAQAPALQLGSREAYRALAKAQSEARDTIQAEWNASLREWSERPSKAYPQGRNLGLGHFHSLEHGFVVLKLGKSIRDPALAKVKVSLVRLSDKDQEWIRRELRQQAEQAKKASADAVKKQASRRRGLISRRGSDILQGN